MSITDIIRPVGYQILVELYKPSKEKDGIIDKSDIAVNDENLSTTVGKVIAMGGDAFQDILRFPNGTYLNVNDWAIFRGYERQRIRVDETDYVFINDDRFLGITTDPARIQTVFSINQYGAR